MPSSRPQESRYRNKVIKLAWTTTYVAFLMTSNHNNKNHYNNCSGDKQSNSQTLILLAAIPHKEAYHH